MGKYSLRDGLKRRDIELRIPESIKAVFCICLFYKIKWFCREMNKICLFSVSFCFQGYSLPLTSLSLDILLDRSLILSSKNGEIRLIWKRHITILIVPMSINLELLVK